MWSRIDGYTTVFRNTTFTISNPTPSQVTTLVSTHQIRRREMHKRFSPSLEYEAAR